MTKYLFKLSKFLLLAYFTVSTTGCSENISEINDGRVNDYETLIGQFPDPGIDYRPAPLWVWNNEVTREDIDHSLAELKKEGIGGVFIHPRRGLITEYLSDEWFELVAYSMEKAKELDMNVWLYDENVCPSGFAGGHVYKEMPESYNLGTSLVTKKMSKLDLCPPERGQVKFVFKNENGSWINITENAAAEEGKTGEYAVLYVQNFRSGSIYMAGFSYVDLIAKGVTEKFMEITMEGYERVGKNEFGKLIPGIFTDEPQIGSEGGFRYTPDLFEEFQKRWGYDLEDELMSLTEESGRWKKVRHDYRTVLLEMFIDRWSKPWYEYTEQNDLIWTGHYWENTWPDIYHGPDNMAMYAWHQMPGIDMLGNTTKDRPDQFGNNITAKELGSIANQFERHRTLSESYGGAGWDIRFEDMKRMGDWQYALGVNFLNQHISQLSLVGFRKQNYPQSFLDYDPYWEFYKSQMDYFARLSLALSSGRQINKTIILEPTTSVWMYYGGGKAKQVKELGDSFKAMLQVLEDHQVEYDLGCENVIKDHGRVQGKKFVVNKRAYDLVVIPAYMENIDNATLQLLQKYISNGGTVLQLGDDPSLVDGEISSGLQELVGNENWIKSTFNSNTINEYLLSDDIQITPSETGRVHHHRRQLNDGDVLFLSNFSLEEDASVVVTIKGASAEEICPQSGEVKKVYYQKSGDEITFTVHLYPGGSYMVYVHDSQIAAPAENPVTPRKTRLELAESKVEPLSPNVLTIDYVTLKLMGKDKREFYYAKASDMIYKAFGYEGGCPWEGVQYKTNFLDMNENHKEGDRFEISYHFDIAPGTDLSGMTLVVEQAAYYDIRVNGKSVQPGNDTWLDPDFNCIDIENEATIGRNEISLSMNRFDNRCEPSPVFIRGDFSLESVNKGWKVIPSNGLEIGSWKDQGYPFFSQSVKYTREINVDKEGNFELQLPNWFGTVSEVQVDNESAGIIQNQPYTKEISLKPGTHIISVIVYGSLKNVFGPHHVYARGFMRPPAFRKGKEIMPSGNEYDFLNYGLMEDFVVSRIE